MLRCSIAAATRKLLKCGVERLMTTQQRPKQRLKQWTKQRTLEEGDWFYSSEWWMTGDHSSSNTVFRHPSRFGNGVVSVLSHPSSRPDRCEWEKTEDWLEQRYSELYPGVKRDGKFRVSDYQWRTLHFNDYTRQSTVKVMAAYCEDRPDSIRLMQQPHCLAVPYVKSMVSAGLASIASSDIRLMRDAVIGKREMKVLCIGHGGGSIPLFLASKIKGAVVHIAEIDPVVISASVEAMGFPSFSVMTPSGERASPGPDHFDEVLWKGTHERLFLFNADAEKFIIDNRNVYDLIFIDAYNGNDDFPHKLWEPNSPFLQALGSRLHPSHGTVVVNLHSDNDLDFDTVDTSVTPLLLKGKNITKMGRSYKDALLEKGGSATGSAHIVSVPWICNASLVVCRGLGRPDSSDNTAVLNTLFVTADKLDKLLMMPFSCRRYVLSNFTLLD